MNPPIGMKFSSSRDGIHSDWIIVSGVFQSIFGELFVIAFETKRRGVSGRFLKSGIWRFSDLECIAQSEKSADASLKSKKRP